MAINFLVSLLKKNWNNVKPGIWGPEKLFPRIWGIWRSQTSQTLAARLPLWIYHGYTMIYPSPRRLHIKSTMGHAPQKRWHCEQDRDWHTWNYVDLNKASPWHSCCWSWPQETLHHLRLMLQWTTDIPAFAVKIRCLQICWWADTLSQFSRCIALSFADWISCRRTVKPETETTGVICGLSWTHQFQPWKVIKNVRWSQCLNAPVEL